MKKNFFIILVVIIFSLLGVFYFRGFSSADPKVDKNGDLRIIDFGKNIGQKAIYLDFSNKANPKIVVKRSVANYCSGKLSGFEDSAKIKSLVNIGKDKNLLEVFGLSQC